MRRKKARAARFGVRPTITSFETPAKTLPHEVRLP
jgi:hypothetical protein